MSFGEFFGKGTMRKAEHSNFWLAYLLNVALNFEWCVPALILLGLHFWLGVPIYFFWIALAVWLIGPLIFMLTVELVKKSIPEDKPQENKNPYSVKNSDIFKKKED